MSGVDIVDVTRRDLLSTDEFPRDEKHDVIVPGKERKAIQANNLSISHCCVHSTRPCIFRMTGSVQSMILGNLDDKN
jgi:hypothetical protein